MTVQNNAPAAPAAADTAVKTDAAASQLQTQGQAKPVADAVPAATV